MEVDEALGLFIKVMLIWRKRRITQVFLNF